MFENTILFCKGNEIQHLIKRDKTIPNKSQNEKAGIHSQALPLNDDTMILHRFSMQISNKQDKPVTRFCPVQSSVLKMDISLHFNSILYSLKLKF